MLVLMIGFVLNYCNGFLSGALSGLFDRFEQLIE